MSDVFISYASEDCEWVSGLALALEEQGWSVWWDREDLIAGGDFENDIQEAINAATQAAGQ